jgi:hypothetical protein
MTELQRGIRNNNPGNVRTGASWMGIAEQQTDPDFVVFKAPVYGLRAIARILTHYRNEGITTVRGVIDRWAPPAENDTEAYIKDVSARCGVEPDAPIDVLAQLHVLIPAIVRHECGEQPYSDDLILDAIHLA